MLLHEIATKEDLQPLLSRIEKLEKENAALKKGLKPWVGTAEAEELLGIKRNALDARRENGDFVYGVHYKKEGAKVLYNRMALEAYNDSHKIRRKYELPAA